MTESPDAEAVDDQWEDEVEDAPSRRRRWVLVALLSVVLVVGGVVLWLSLRSTAPKTVLSVEGVPIQQVPDLAPAGTTMTGAPVDGITCRGTFQQVVGDHIHVHVAIFVNGRQERIPAGAGMAAPRLAEHLANGLYYTNSFDGCLYWLHVHTNDGILHVESRYFQQFTLGQFFDIWQQPLSPDQVGPAKGRVVAFENGGRFSGNPHDIPLLPHAVIQLDVGTPVVPFKPLQFKVIGLCGSGTLGCSAGYSPAVTPTTG